MTKFLATVLMVVATFTMPAHAATSQGSKSSATPKQVSSCPCGGRSLCVGPRGGRYCIAPGGKKRYVKK